MPLTIGTDRAIDDLKNQALTAVDDAAAKARNRFMTTMRAKQNEYDEKNRIAQMALTRCIPQLSGEPMMAAIKAESQARGITQQAMLKIIRDRRTESDNAVAKIALITSPVKVKIRAATTAQEIAKIRCDAIREIESV